MFIATQLNWTQLTQLNSVQPSQSCFCLWRHDLQTESTGSLRALIGDSCSRCECVDNSTSSWVQLCRYKRALHSKSRPVTWMLDQCVLKSLQAWCLVCSESFMFFCNPDSKQTNRQTDATKNKAFFTTAGARYLSQRKDGWCNRPLICHTRQYLKATDFQTPDVNTSWNQSVEKTGGCGGKYTHTYSFIKWKGWQTATSTMKL